MLRAASVPFFLAALLLFILADRRTMGETPAHGTGRSVEVVGDEDDPDFDRPNESEEFDMPEAIGFHYDQRKSEDGTVPPNALIIAREDVDGMNGRVDTRTAGITNASWTAIGPNNIGGRIRS